MVREGKGNNRASRIRRKRIRRIRRGIVCLLAGCIIYTGSVWISSIASSNEERPGEQPDIRKEWKKERQPQVRGESPAAAAEKNSVKTEIVGTTDSWETEGKLKETLEKYPQTLDFVKGYPQRSQYQGKDIDLSGEVEPEKVPLFLQWDKRWGYDLYGNELIGIAGCGPTCMSMAYTYLTKTTEMNPREMSEFAYCNGYYTKNGTSWDFFEEGAELLGLTGREIGLDEVRMKQELDRGNLIICSMRPGDFTAGGHFILIRGYDEEGFMVNDPNSRENSEKHWTYDEISWQIKCLWSVGN